MSTFPLPLNSYEEFEAFFDTFEPGSSRPVPLPVPSPTKSFWSHPGLSKDWPTSQSDPDGSRSANPYAREGSEGSLTEDADIVIIGSGITGVSIALELARLARDGGRAKMKVAILEARDFCSGATARNGGHLTASISHNYSSLAEMYDPKEVKRCFELERHTVSSLLKLIQEGGWADYVDLVEGGHNVLMFSEEERQKALTDYHKAREAGVISKDQVQWFTPEETNHEYGASYVMCRTAGHNLWPLKLVTKMFELARDGMASASKLHKKPQSDTSGSWTSGVRGILKTILPSSLNIEQSQPFELVLHTHTPVKAVSANQSTTTGKWSVQTARGTMLTNYVVYATNAYTSHLLPHMSGPRGIVPVRGQVVAIRADVGYTDEGWEANGGQKGLSRSGWSGNEGFEYWFPRPHPKATTDAIDPAKPRKPLIILGGARETLRDRGYGMYETDDSVLDPEASAGLRVFLGHVFPGQFPTVDTVIGSGSADSERAGVEVEWTGIMGFTKSGDPFVGRVKDAEGQVIKGQYLAAGFTGHGMPRAYGCAEALASLIWSDITGSTWTPPDWLPLHYLTESF